MRVQEATAPSYDTMRPLKPTTTATFPVYGRLDDLLAEAKTHPDPLVAHVLATCSGYAYSSADTVAMIMARLGLEDNRCRQVDLSVDAMFVRSTSFLVQSSDGRVVILAYRGTEPANFINWLTDADIDPERVRFAFPEKPADVAIHAGFYRNVRATRYQIVSSLQRALRGQSILEDATHRASRGTKGGRAPDDGLYPLEALYITGHSLGGAMAAVMAIMLTTEPAYRDIANKLRAVYTFGQPMVGDAGLAGACDAEPFLRDNLIRYVYGRDLVPALPPRASGRFMHFGQELRYHPSWLGGHWQSHASPTGQARWLAQVALAPLTFVARQVRITRKLRLLPYALEDHGPQRYIAALTPRHVKDEFGDFRGAQTDGSPETAIPT